ncbi:hypothetical protein AAFN85_16035 [Mucilaginibacter sp. CAU 1740]|uniref:DUF922 domain-containing protein n=1 Tax=Mucilaginibacter sp. CAU 1740 TaxID=3140365 RepID=UPI00325A50EB
MNNHLSLKFTFVILLFWTLNIAKGFSQEKKWSKDSLLTWNDFKGTVDPASGVSAMTYCGVKFRYRYFVSANDSTYTAKFIVYSFFTPERSWSMVERQCPPLLNHEQVHFDISEYFARVLRTALETAQYTKNIKDEIMSIFKKYDSEREKMGLLYDEQTNHGTKVDVQKKWDLFVGKILSNNTPWQQVQNDEIMLKGF